MRIFILSLLLSWTTFFSGIKESKLSDISKPYLGEYECISAQLGSLDCLKQFSYARLELKGNEEFCLHYREKGGKKKECKGKYIYDKDKNEIEFIDESEAFRRVFPLCNGILTISVPVGEKILVLQFEQK